jgi:hypothetical protein
MLSPRGVRRLCAIGLVAVLVACANVLGPRSFRLSEAELNTLVARQFPHRQRMAEVFDVRVDAPRLTLMPEANRIATELPIVATERLFGRAYPGRLSLDYGLHYDERDQSIRLSQVHVNRFVMDGLPDALAPMVSHLGGLLAEQLLRDFEVYHFKPEDLKRAEGRGYQPGELTVTSRGIEVALNPIP